MCVSEKEIGREGCLGRKAIPAQGVVWSKLMEYGRGRERIDALNVYSQFTISD